MTAPNLNGAIAGLLSSIWIASPALAYHGTSDHGGAPVAAIVPIVIGVVVGVIVLSLWKPQSRNAKAKAKAKKRDRAPGHRASQRRHKRARQDRPG